MCVCVCVCVCVCWGRGGGGSVDIYVKPSMLSCDDGVKECKLVIGFMFYGELYIWVH